MVLKIKAQNDFRAYGSRSNKREIQHKTPNKCTSIFPFFLSFKKYKNKKGMGVQKGSKNIYSNFVQIRSA